MSSHEFINWQLAVDGASRANPGISGIGIAISKNNRPFAEFGFFTGIKTNNQAEYLALVVGLLMLGQHAGENDSVTIFSDSELMVRQLNGEYRVKNSGLRVLFQLGKSLFSSFNAVVEHVPRERNKQADLLANRGIDQREPLPSEILAVLNNHAIVL